MKAALLPLILSLTAALAAETSVTSSSNPELTKKIAQLKARGPDAPLTVLPVILGGGPFDRVSEVVALGLEKQGLKNIELGTKAFVPGETMPMEQLPEALATFVRLNPPVTDYVLFADFRGTQQSGLNELRAVVADKSGSILWTDRQTAPDEAFKKADAREPLTMAMFLVDRLGPHLGLNADTAKAATPGKFARLMDERSGLPPQAERDAIPARQKALVVAHPKAALLVVPLAAPDHNENEITTRLAKAIGDAKFFKSVASLADASAVSAPRPDPNEMKMPWDLARVRREQVKKNAPAADYVLCADYRFNPDNWEQGYLHFVVCDQQGKWVIVEMQYSHRKTYQNIKPTSKHDCEELLVKRMNFFLHPDEPAAGM